MNHKTLRQLLAVTLIAAKTSSGGYGAEEEPNPWIYADKDHSAAASDILLPMTSFILPGAGQWARGQVGYGSIYTGLAFAGVAYAANASTDVSKSDLRDADLGRKNIAKRKYALGLQTTQSMGGLSLYHSFRSAVWQRQKYKQYQFLGKGEAPSEILLAPFHFEYLTRPSTLVPLAVATGIMVYAVNHPSRDYRRVPFTPADGVFAAGFSYNAGTHEEAVFRGWLMPVLYEAGLSKTIANLAQSTGFALAHLGTTPIPLPQFLLGLHFGRVTTNNQWSLGESIFTHVWWDVIVFSGNYFLDQKRRKNVTGTGMLRQTKPLALTLPPIYINF